MSLACGQRWRRVRRIPADWWGESVISTSASRPTPNCAATAAIRIIVESGPSGGCRIAVASCFRTVSATGVGRVAPTHPAAAAVGVVGSSQSPGGNGDHQRGRGERSAVAVAQVTGARWPIERVSRASLRFVASGQCLLDCRVQPGEAIPGELFRHHVLAGQDVAGEFAQYSLQCECRNR